MRIPDIEWTDEELRASAAWLHEQARTRDTCEAKHAGVAYTELCEAIRNKPRLTNENWKSLVWMGVWLALGEASAVSASVAWWGWNGILTRVCILIAGVYMVLAWRAAMRNMRYHERESNLRIRAESEAAKPVKR